MIFLYKNDKINLFDNYENKQKNLKNKNGDIMKYIKKLPKENKEYSQKLLDSGWKKIKEPKLWVAMLIGLPIGILSALLNIKYFFMFFYLIIFILLINSNLNISLQNNQAFFSFHLVP